MLKSKLLRFIVIFGAWLLTADLSADDDKTIKLIADDWCPINCDPKSPNQGILIDIAKEVFTKAGYSISYDTITWNQAVKSVEAGINDGLVGAGDNEVPPERVILTEEPLAKVDDCIYTSAEIGKKWKFSHLPNIKDLDALRKSEYPKIEKSVGAIKDYAYGEETMEYIKQNPAFFHTAFGDKALHQLIKMTKNGKLMSFLEGPWIAAYNLKILNITDAQVMKAGCIGKPTGVYIAFTAKKPRSKELATILNAGVKEMRANGKMKAILDRYSVEDIP